MRIRLDRKLAEAAAFAVAGAVLTYFGFMHGEAVGIGGGAGVTPSVALAYAVVAALLYAFSRMPAAQPAAMPAEATVVAAE